MDKKEIISDLKNSIRKVGPEYYQVPSLNGRVIYSERAFAYELYHQIRRNFKSPWYVNGELRKSMVFIPKSNSESVYIPDLIIHEHHTTDENIAAIEIKASPNTSAKQIIDDLQKLEVITRPEMGELNFKMGILLLINYNFWDNYNSMNESNKDSISALLIANPRIAIWNISDTLFERKSSTEATLISEIKIIRQPNFSL
jgi:hypothetical protein